MFVLVQVFLPIIHRSYKIPKLSKILPFSRKLASDKDEGLKFFCPYHAAIISLHHAYVPFSSIPAIPNNVCTYEPLNLQPGLKLL